MNDKYCLVLGRFQPLHEGHKKLIQTLLDEDKKVCVMLMDTEKDKKNPYGIAERMSMLSEVFGDDIVVTVVPPVAEFCYGRNVGYHIRPIYFPIERDSATAIRTGKPMAPFETDTEFLESFRRIAEKVHELSAAQGFWPKGKQTDISYKIAHAHSELSEAWEYARIDGPDKNIEDMFGLEVQLGDVLGILMDMEIAYGLHISEALLRKIKFNETREYLHGKKF